MKKKKKDASLRLEMHARCRSKRLGSFYKPGWTMMIHRIYIQNQPEVCKKEAKKEKMRIDSVLTRVHKTVCTAVGMIDG